MKRRASEVTLNERQTKALKAICAWEFAAALRMSDADLVARGQFIERALACFPVSAQEHIEYRTKLAQYNGLRDAAEARGLWTE